MYLSTDIQIVEHPFIIKPRTLSSPTNFVGLSLLIAVSIPRALIETNSREAEEN
jgi:hypothetical protein